MTEPLTHWLQLQMMNLASHCSAAGRSDLSREIIQFVERLRASGLLIEIKPTLTDDGLIHGTAQLAPYERKVAKQ